MLIQITNKCHMQCPHCMQDSTPQGKHMTEETFLQVLDFCKDASPMIVNISGGEPTEHPDFVSYVKRIMMIPGVKVICILTNGSWIEDTKKRIAMAKLIKAGKNSIKVQVYSNPLYYRNHKWTVLHEAQYRSIGCIPDFNSPIYMQDLGRARTNCTKEVEQSSFVPSCINSHLLALQARDLRHFMTMAFQAGKFCRPLIDPDGNIHMSESWLCKSVAHVSDGVEVAFWKMQGSRPCKGCRLYKNFAELHPKEMEVLKL